MDEVVDKIHQALWKDGDGAQVHCLLNDRGSMLPEFEEVNDVLRDSEEVFAVLRVAITTASPVPGCPGTFVSSSTCHVPTSLTPLGHTQISLADTQTGLTLQRYDASD